MDLAVWTEPVVEASALADELRYTPDEVPLIEDMILGAQSLLYNADVFVTENPMVKTVIRLIVGFWLENREGMTSDNRSIESLPFGVTAMINSLRFYRKVGDENAEGQG